MFSRIENMIGRYFLTVLLGTVFILGGRAASAEDKLTVIRVGTTAPGHLKFILSQDQKFWDKEFEKDGIKIDYLPFTGGGSEVGTALATGAIDIAYTGASPALRLAAKKANVKFVAISSTPVVGSSSIFVPVKSPLRTVSDLKGKKVAYLAGTIRHSVLTKALQASNLSLKDIESLNLPFEASGPALLRGDIDALVESENTLASLVDKGVVRVLLDGTKHPEWTIPSLVTVNGNFAKRYPEILKRFLKADLQISQWADANFDKSVSIHARLTRSTEIAVRNDYPTGKFSNDPRITDEIVRGLQSEEAFMKEAGLLNGSIDFKTWLDRSYIDAVYAGK